MLYCFFFLVQCNSKFRNKTVVPTSKESNQIPVTDNLMKLILNSFQGSSGNLICIVIKTIHYISI